MPCQCIVAGTVILMMDSKLEPSVAKEMMKGAPDTLHSGEAL